ncbi:MAG: hypothetical protein LBG77_04445, partial [Dysgonamonadaceae bacterium]|nr:hypothetical protein [Dysgonamonadaceae bacterium]
MAEGKWVQLKITENAVYKLTYEQIKQMGFSDPAKIGIYGYGGWILDQDFRQPYIDDLPEVAVYLNKGADGIFNAGDFLLFYGRGLTKWNYDSSRDLFVHQNNPYSLFASYFIAENANGPKEIALQSSYSETVASVDLFDDYLVHEKDLTAILHSGRELFGESFVTSSSRNFTFTVPGITNDAGKVRLFFAAAPQVSTPVTLSIGSENIINATIAPVYSGSVDYQKAQVADKTGTWTGAKSENITVNIQYNPNQSSVAYLNYFTLNMKRKLQFYGTGYT